MLSLLELPLFKKVLFVLGAVSFFTILIFYSGPTNIVKYAIVISTPETETSDIHFLVSSSKCKMSNLNPFNNDAKKFYEYLKYSPCRDKDLLTYTTVQDNIATLHIDNKMSPSYGENLTCCYSNVTRKPDKSSPDSKIQISKCVNFQNNVSLTTDVVMVRCKDMSKNATVYENAHSLLIVTPSVQKKLENAVNSTSKISILFVGIDSISRLNFIRTMPKTFKYVEENDWLPLVGYNKMDDNTFPNLMAIFTGMNQTRQYEVCKPKSVGQLDKCPIIFYDYGKYDYVTGYGEDEATISTFNYKKKGFTKPPTDYYFRPYSLAFEELKTKRIDSMKWCTGPETSGERILNLAKDFSNKFKEYPHFGLFWMNSFSHNQLNTPSRMDGKVKEFLEGLADDGLLNNDIVIFLSDHGMRFGKIRLTYTGWLEERLPFIYVWFPPWFREKFPTEYNNFKNNRHKLTSPYDLHMTLQHIFLLSGLNRTMVPSEACPKCKSLLENIESERSCEDVGVVEHWCTCAGYKDADLKSSESSSLANYVISEINKIVSTNETVSKCAQYSVKNILSTSISEALPYRKTDYILIKLETFPKALFETTVSFNGDIKDSKFEITGDISRLDMYAPHSYCMEDSYLKKYCYCR